MVGGVGEELVNQCFLNAFRDQHGVDAMDVSVAGADVADGDRCRVMLRGPARGVLGGGPLVGLVGARRGCRLGLAERREGLVHRSTGCGAVIVLERLGGAVDGAAGLLKRLALGRLNLAAIDGLTGAGELVAGRLSVLTIAGKRLIGVLQGAERVGQVLVGGGRRGAAAGVAAVELVAVRVCG